MNTRALVANVVVAFALLLRPAVAEEVVELIPDQRPGLGASNIFAPFTSLFLGPSYWYKAREIRVETVPPGAALDLFYIRASFQKGYEQATAPVTVRLPSRVEAGKRDIVTIRALLDGYQQQEVRVPVRSRQTEVLIELAPLANSLVALTHTYLAGRGTLAFLTREQLAFRVQKRDDGFSVVLNETALADVGLKETIAGIRSPLVQSLEPQQLGEDLLVRVTLAESAQGGAVEARTRQTYDPVRGLHTFAIDLVPPDGGAEAVQRAKAALARIRSADVSGCSLVYDSALREQLETAALSRALAADGSFTDPYLREAMKRLGQLSADGVVELVDGSRYRVSAPIELMAASTQSAEVIGYLALLRRFVAELEPRASRRQTLHGLISPELAGDRFDAIADAAEARERRCLGGGGGAGAGERL